jgi:hypothetical protein
MASSACLRRGGHLRPEVGLGLQHLALRHARSQQRHHDLAVPPGRLGRGDPAQTVPADPKPPLDANGAEPLCQLELDRRHDLQLVLVDGVLRTWLGEADGLADHQQQLQGDLRPCAQLLEGRAAEPGELVEGGHVQEGERERSIPDGGGHPVERHAGPLQALHPARPAHITGREGVSRNWRQDAELDQPVDVVGVDPGPLGDLLPGVSAHVFASIASCRRAGVACSLARAHESSSQRVGVLLEDAGAVAHRSVKSRPYEAGWRFTQWVHGPTDKKGL